MIGLIPFLFLFSCLIPPHLFQNGSTRFISGSKAPFPKEKHDEATYSVPEQAASEGFDSDADFDKFDLPEVPKQPVHSNQSTGSAPDVVPFPTSAASESGLEESVEDKQFVPFISPPPQSSASFPVKQRDPPPPVLKPKGETIVDLQDVLLAAQAATETADQAAAAARSAATLAQLRISELAKKTINQSSDACLENPFHKDRPKSDAMEKASSGSPTPSPKGECRNFFGNRAAVLPAYHDTVISHDTGPYQPQRLPFMDDETFFSYPNLFTSQGTNLSSHAQSFTDNSQFHP